MASSNEMHYVKIWLLLLVLLAVSVIGPEFEIPIVTLITAFGVAIVKAYIVAVYFMHLSVEKKYIHYMLYSMVLIMFLFVVGSAADVMKFSGTNWEKKSAIEHAELHKK